MTKIISLIQAAPEIDAIAMQELWMTSVLTGLLDLKGVRNTLERITYNRVLPASIRDDPEAVPSMWAGASEIWFQDRQSTEAFLKESARLGLFDSHSSTLRRIVHLHVEEKMMWDHGGKHDALKAMAFFHPRSGLKREEAQRYWNVEHVAEGARLGLGQKLSKYVQNHTFPDYHSADPSYDYAGGPELWFNSLDDANSLFADETKVAELGRDEAKFADRSSAAMLVVKELPVFGY